MAGDDDDTPEALDPRDPLGLNTREVQHQQRRLLLRMFNDSDASSSSGESTPGADPVVESPRPPEPSEQQPKVAALCCMFDVAGGAVLASSEEVVRGNEQLLELIERCQHVVRQHRGYLVGTFGTQALYVFGYPRADDRDAHRAACAAIDMIAAVESRGQIGLHFGHIVDPSHAGAGHGDLALGTTQSFAARLAALAKPGTILASEPLCRLASAQLEFEATGASSIHRLHARRESGSGTDA